MTDDDSVALGDRVEVLERMSASLDPDAVLQEAVDSACALTGARYGVIATVDGAGPARGLVGSGLRAAGYRRFMDWADAPRLFASAATSGRALRFENVARFPPAPFETGVHRLVRERDGVELKRRVPLLGQRAPGVGFGRTGRFGPSADSPGRAR